MQAFIRNRSKYESIKGGYSFPAPKHQLGFIMNNKQGRRFLIPPARIWSSELPVFSIMTYIYVAKLNAGFICLENGCHYLQVLFSFFQFLTQLIVQFSEYTFRAHFVKQFCHLLNLFIGQLPVSGDIPEFCSDNVKTDHIFLVFSRDHLPDFAAGVGKSDRLVQETVGQLSALVRIGIDDLLIFLAVDDNLQCGLGCLVGDLCRRHSCRRCTAFPVWKACSQCNRFLECFPGIKF